MLWEMKTAVLFHGIVVFALLFFVAVLRQSFGKDSKTPIIALATILSWLIFQGVLSLSGFYTTHLDAMPPRMLAMILPPILLIVYLLVFKKEFIASINLEQLNYIHVIRVPIEIGIMWLCTAKAMPEEMTYDGRNLDIIVGMTAPFVAFLYFNRKTLSRNMYLVWNIFGLIMLANVVGMGILSAPTPLQKMAFDQPNIAVLYYPFSWLVCFLVPLVLFIHIVSIKSIWSGKEIK